MPIQAVVPIEVTSVMYGVEGWLDLPLIVLALLLALVVAFLRKQPLFLILAVALGLFAGKQAVFYTGLEPTPAMRTAQMWMGTLGWLLVCLFVGASIRRRSG